MKDISELKSLAFRLTSRCNLNCMFCGQSKQAITSKGSEKSTNSQRSHLSLDQLKYIVNQLVVYRPQIYLWGGEPLIYPYLSDFVRYLRANKLSVFITTNGVLLNRFYV